MSGWWGKFGDSSGRILDCKCLEGIDCVIFNIMSLVGSIVLARHGYLINIC